MVEMETHQSKPESETITNIDINAIINRVREFIDNIKGMSGDGKPMTVRVDSFNFAFDKEGGEYTLTFKTKLAIAPKEDKAAS